MVAPTYSPRVWEVGAEGDGGVQGDPWLHSQFEASMKYMKQRNRAHQKFNPHPITQTKPNPKDRKNSDWQLCLT